MRHLRAFHALALLGIGASAMLLVGLVTLTGRMDRDERRREIALVSTQVDSGLAQARQSAANAGRSDEAIIRLDHAHDMNWARATFPSKADGSLRIYTFDHADGFITDAGRPSREWPASFDEQMALHVARLRRLPASPGAGGPVDLAAGVTETFRVEDEFYLLLVAAFSAVSPGVRLTHDAPPLLAGVTPWRRFLADTLAGDGIERATVRATKPGPGEAGKDLTDAFGNVVGVIVWRPVRPGAELLRVVLPSLLALVMLFVALVAWTYRRAVAAARALLASETRALHVASHDELTGLANRRFYIGELEAAHARAVAGLARPAVMLIDLDGFKSVNDTWGHQCGDELIRYVARRLLSACGPEGLCARLGGDEFVVLVRDCATVDLAGLAERVRTALSGRVQLSGAVVEVAGSAGMSIFCGQASSEELMREADVALYRSKQDCRGSLSLFHRDPAPVTGNGPIRSAAG